jgi:lysophospholipase L1-like esterase
MFGLGDSVPAADTCGCRGFLEQSADLLAPLIGRPVGLHNDAVDGWTTATVVNALHSGAVRKDLAGGAGLVVIEAGANDLPLGKITDPSCQPVVTSSCFRPTLTAVGQALTMAVDLIRKIDPDHHPQIVLMGYWNVGVDGDVGRRRGQAYLTDSNELTLALNQVVRTVVARTGTIYVDAYTPLKGPDGGRDPSPYLLPDGDHPNRAGHLLLAEQLITRLKQTGAVAAWSARH